LEDGCDLRAIVLRVYCWIREPFRSASSEKVESWSCQVVICSLSQQGEGIMLFLGIFTYAPEDRDQVVERRLTTMKKDQVVEIKGEWFDVSGHRVFRLFECDDDAHLAASTFYWGDLGVAEIIPVMETERAVKLLQKFSRKKS
jgi:hypothetical protein